MAENCSVVDPWLHYKEPWMSEAFARDNAALTKALQISISSTTTASSTATTITSPDSVSGATSHRPFFHHHQSQPPAAVDRRRNPLAAAPNGKVTKRKSRASKRSPTTYINADVENFREMVQRVTGGGRFSGEPGSDFELPVLLPEPVRLGASNRAVQPPVCLPTLDTSAFLLDQGIIAPVRDGSFEPIDELVFDIDTLVSSFPTLESWGVM